MNRDERQALRQSLASFKPGQFFEVRVDRLRALLAQADQVGDEDGVHCAACGDLVAVYAEDPAYCHRCRP